MHNVKIHNTGIAETKRTQKGESEKKKKKDESISKWINNFQESKVTICEFEERGRKKKGRKGAKKGHQIFFIQIKILMAKKKRKREWGERNTIKEDTTQSTRGGEQEVATTTREKK